MTPRSIGLGCDGDEVDAIGRVEARPVLLRETGAAWAAAIDDRAWPPKA